VITYSEQVAPDPVRLHHYPIAKRFALQRIYATNDDDYAINQSLTVDKLKWPEHAGINTVSKYGTCWPIPFDLRFNFKT
jgi:hypothetical protein